MLFLNRVPLAFFQGSLSPIPVVSIPGWMKEGVVSARSLH